MKIPNKQRKYITEFIHGVNTKDFARANDALKQVIQEKIKERIKTVSTKPLF